MSNGTDPTLLVQSYVPPPFPTWPPPSGGAPVTNPETGPVTNPFPYGSTQTANISTANPAPLQKATFFPTKMPVGATGQNQPQQLPLSTKAWEMGPLKASPLLSQIQPPPIMGPGAQGTAPY